MRVRLIDVNDASFDSLPCCGIKSATHPGRQEKRCWMRENAMFGLRARTLIAPNGRPIGYIEYLPGEFAWRGVNAAGYLFIHCISVHSKPHQRRGCGSMMLQAVLDDAKSDGRNGVAVMTREGPWMADRRLFLANGFETADTAPPDYELMVRKFDVSAPNPTFRKHSKQELAEYGRGLTLIRSSQCPHIAKFASEIAETAESEYHIKPTVIDLRSCSEAQAAPTPYAVFALIYNGQVLADHQISRTRFRNIMNKLAT